MEHSNDLLLLDDSESTSESVTETNDEIIVLTIETDRINKKKDNRIEYYVHWADGTKSWEPIGSLKDEDGTENIQLIRYDIRKEAVITEPLTRYVRFQDSVLLT